MTGEHGLTAEEVERRLAESRQASGVDPQPPAEVVEQAARLIHATSDDTERGAA